MNNNLRQQISNPDIAIADDGTTDVNALPITITQPTVVFTGTLNDLNNSLQLAQSQLGIDTQKLADATTQLQAVIDADQANIDSIQATIDSVTPQIQALPARTITTVDPAVPTNDATSTPITN